MTLKPAKAESDASDSTPGQLYTLFTVEAGQGPLFMIAAQAL